MWCCEHLAWRFLLPTCRLLALEMQLLLCDQSGVCSPRIPTARSPGSCHSGTRIAFPSVSDDLFLISVVRMAFSVPACTSVLLVTSEVMISEAEAFSAAPFSFGALTRLALYCNPSFSSMGFQNLQPFPHFPVLALLTPHFLAPMCAFSCLDCWYERPIVKCRCALPTVLEAVKPGARHVHFQWLGGHACSLALVPVCCGLTRWKVRISFQGLSVAPGRFTTAAL